MSHAYQAVGWNPQKRAYDLTMAAIVVGYLVLFIALGALLYPHATAETLMIRAFGSAALILLHVILTIGPLCRIQPAYLPLLYNRRHMGVTMFLLAAFHGILSLIQFHALGDVDPLVSLFVSEWPYISNGLIPFQPLGFFALVLLFLMAATSHDFWLANLTAPVWKALHMGVYLAYALLIGHVSFGILQAEVHPFWSVTVASGFAWLLGLHWIASRREKKLDVDAEAQEGWILVGPYSEIPDNCARVVCGSGERIAVFRYQGKISAVSSVCQHQNGPLGEGRVIDGCITCPWHGYQYHPHNGSSPEPFTEKVPTFRVKITGDEVWVHEQPLPAGTHVDPLELPHE